MRPIYQQVEVVKNMLKVLGNVFQNEPEVQNTSFAYSEGYNILRFNEYEIWWDDDERDFTIFVDCYGPGSYWEPPDGDVVELGTFTSLYEAVLYCFRHSVENVYRQFMDGEEEYALDQEVASVNWVPEPNIACFC